MAQNLNQVPPGLEVWEVMGQTYLVRINDRLGRPIPMVWAVENAERRTALGITAVDRTFGSWSEFYATGALSFGSSLELANTTIDPLEQIYSNYETEVKVKPWLADGEILTLWMAAQMEGRGISEAELQGSVWWRTHTDAERQWISLNAADPATANQLISDNRIRVSEMFKQAGIDNASSGLIEQIADRLSQGAWSEPYAISQIRALADPHLGGSIDPVLTDFRSGLDTTRQREDDVRSMLTRWLGPAFGTSWSDEQVASWASQLRENPDATQDLTDILRKHRQALFPEYEDANLTYEDIAAPWRGVWSQEWGGVADETDPLFAQIIRANNIDTARELLRTEGLKKNNPTVVENAVGALSRAFGGQVRPSSAAIT